MNNKNYYKKHQELLKSWSVMAQKEWPKCRIFNRDVGFFRTMRGTPIRIGTKGESDIQIFIPYGNGHVLLCSAEFKTGNAKQTKEQKSYEAMINKLGGFYVIIRDKDDVEQINNELIRRLNP